MQCLLSDAITWLLVRHLSRQFSTRSWLKNQNILQHNCVIHIHRSRATFRCPGTSTHSTQGWVDQSRSTSPFPTSSNATQEINKIQAPSTLFHIDVPVCTRSSSTKGGDPWQLHQITWIHTKKLPTKRQQTWIHHSALPRTLLTVLRSTMVQTTRPVALKSYVLSLTVFSQATPMLSL